MLRSFFNTLSRSNTMQRMAAGFGPARRIARRFTAGETLDDAVAVVKELNSRGIGAILNHLGEGVDSQDAAREAADHYGKIVERADAADLDATLSIKPTHLGVGFGESFFLETMSPLVEKASRTGRGIEIDMEDSSLTDATLNAYLALLDRGATDLRIALQTCLFRTENDLLGLVERGGRVRLVKGAYDEPADRSWKKKHDVDRNFAHLVGAAFGDAARESGFHPAFGTHDQTMIDKIRAVAEERGARPDDFEFQMLLGVRRDLQQRLADDGFRVRVYVPFGSHWYPYFMRRIAERPANALFVARAMLGD